jgi:ribosomal protein S18 acetylase RimI-like enzyme
MTEGTTMITIEDIQRKHIRSLHEVIDTVSREKKFLAWTEAPPFGLFKVFVTNGIVKRNPQVVSLDDGKVVGWCDITALPRPTTKHCGVLGMGVLPAYRHKGIGTRLLHAALKKAKAYGLYRVELEVFEDNLSAIELYKKVGFQVEGRKVGSVRIDDRYVNALMMALLLHDYPEETA